MVRLPATDQSPNLFLFVARRPTPGEAKTRLGQAIGMERAAALYAAFLVDLCQRFTPWHEDPPGYDFGWAHSPAGIDFGSVLVGLAGEPSPAWVRFVGQEGAGLVERLANLFAWSAAQGYRRTVIMATDSPHLPPAVATSAFAALTDRDVVLGRTSDGGYYLIGLTGVHDVLSGTPLSTGQEADALIARAGALDLSVAELPASFDVDEAGDLRRLYTELAPDGHLAPTTWNALHRLALLDVCRPEVVVETAAGGC